MRIEKSFIDQTIEKTKFEVTATNRCVFVTAFLPNGFILNESSCALSEENFSKEVGEEICKKKIIDEMWKLYAFAKAEQMYDEIVDGGIVQ